MALINKRTSNITVEKATNQHDVAVAKAQAEASKSGDRILAEAKLERDQADDRKERPWAYDENFYSHYRMMQVSFPSSDENVAKTVERVLNETKGRLNEYERTEVRLTLPSMLTFMLYKWVMELGKVFQSFVGEPKICAEAGEAITKAQEGINKIKQQSSSYNLSFLMQQLSESKQLVDSVKNGHKKAFMIKGGLALAFWASLCIYAAVR